ncbi:protransforming growth factor alpha [Psammomys obesus]|uniref:protransforming growth factor alpha n=1 Tax=Psammomys obesus TaxID=48139 RepID=UPI002452F8FD|nr:protransforming growth factor alpha [Psammomys obesus]
MAMQAFHLSALEVSRSRQGSGHRWKSEFNECLANYGESAFLGSGPQVAGYARSRVSRLRIKSVLEKPLAQVPAPGSQSPPLRLRGRPIAGGWSASPRPPRAERRPEPPPLPRFRRRQRSPARATGRRGRPSARAPGAGPAACAFFPAHTAAARGHSPTAGSAVAAAPCARKMVPAAGQLALLALGIVSAVCQALENSTSILSDSPVAAAVVSHFNKCPDSHTQFCFHGTCRFLVQEEKPACV